MTLESIANLFQMPEVQVMLLVSLVSLIIIRVVPWEIVKILALLAATPGILIVLVVGLALLKLAGVIN